jgi:pyruvate dehydrogenase E1 component alpha subunit
MLRHLYATMLRCRVIEENMLALAKSGKLKVAPPAQLGEEATSIGSMIELRPGDAIAAEPSAATGVICGAPLGLLFAEMLQLRAEYLAFAPEAAHSTIHLVPPAATVAARMNMAAGFAAALKAEQRTDVVLVLLRDGYNDLGFWHEAATVAAAERLPIIFVATRKLKSAGGTGSTVFRERASAYGIPGISVDGNDVIAVWRVTQESIHRARCGTGPTLIDSEMLDTQAVSNGSVESWDSLRRMQRYLDKRQLWDESWKDGLIQKITDEMEEVQKFFGHAGKK